MIALVEDDAMSLVRLGLEREQEGDHEAALSVLLAAMRLDPVSWPAAHASARVAARLQSWPALIEATDRMIELNPAQLGKGYISRSHVYLKQQSDDGFDRFELLAREFAPPGAYEPLAMACLRFNRIDAGQAWLRRYCLSQPFADGAPFPNVAHERIWEYLAAFEHDGSAVEPRVAMMLARMELAVGLVDAAKARLVGLSAADSADLDYLRAVVCNRTGEWDEARRLLKRAAHLDPGREDIARAWALTRASAALRVQPPTESRSSTKPLLAVFDPQAPKQVSSWWFLRRLSRSDLGAIVRVEALRADASQHGWVFPVYLGSSLRMSPAIRDKPGEAFLFDLLSDDVIAGLRRRNGILLIDHGCEGLFWHVGRDDRRILLEFVDHLKTLGIPPTSVAILDGNLSAPQIADLIARETGAPLPRIIAGRHAWLEMVQIYRNMDNQQGGADDRLSGSSKTVLTGQRRPHRFLALNAAPRPHRSALVAYLLDHGLLANGLVSFGGPAYIRRQKGQISDESWLRRTAAEIEELAPFADARGTLEELLRLGPLQVDTPFEVSGGTLSKTLGRTNNDAWPYQDSYVSFVTDTNFSDGGSVLVSEKLSRPIANLHPFIYIGEPGVLAVLKAEGYRTFGDWIDESYDAITDRRERMGAILSEVHRLASMRIEDLHAMYIAAWPTLIHNYERFFVGEPLEAERLVEALSSIVSETCA